MYTSSFLCTKPRLSQARALLFPKVFVPLGINPSLTGKNIFHKFSGCFM